MELLQVFESARVQVDGLIDELVKVIILEFNVLSDPLYVGWIVVRFSCHKVLQPYSYLKVGTLQVEALADVNLTIGVGVDSWIVMLQ